MTDTVTISRELLETIEQTWRVHDKHSAPDPQALSTRRLPTTAIAENLSEKGLAPYLEI